MSGFPSCLTIFVLVAFSTNVFSDAQEHPENLPCVKAAYRAEKKCAVEVYEKHFPLASTETKFYTALCTSLQEITENCFDAYQNCLTKSQIEDQKSLFVLNEMWANEESMTDYFKNECPIVKEYFDTGRMDKPGVSTAKCSNKELKENLEAYEQCTNRAEERGERYFMRTYDAFGFGCMVLGSLVEGECAKVTSECANPDEEIFNFVIAKLAMDTPFITNLFIRFGVNLKRCDSYEKMVKARELVINRW